MPPGTCRRAGSPTPACPGGWAGPVRPAWPDVLMGPVESTGPVVLAGLTEPVELAGPAGLAGPTGLAGPARLEGLAGRAARWARSRAGSPSSRRHSGRVGGGVAAAVSSAGPVSSPPAAPLSGPPAAALPGTPDAPLSGPPAAVLSGTPAAALSGTPAAALSRPLVGPAGAVSSVARRSAADRTGATLSTQKPDVFSVSSHSLGSSNRSRAASSDGISPA